MKLFTLYVLRDPAGAIRYVGKTQQPPKERFARHIRDAKERNANGNFVDNTHRANWIRKVLRAGDLPKMQILNTYSSLEGLNGAERLFIKHIPNLTNATAGGDGCVVPRKPNCSDEQVIQLYLAGKSGKNIAKTLRTCAKRVFVVLRRAGIKIRPSAAVARCPKGGS